MGPKSAAKSKWAKSDAVSFEETAPPVPESPVVIDPYKGFRYTPLKKHSQHKLITEVKLIPVMKKQKLAAMSPTVEDDSLTIESDSTKRRASQFPEGHYRSLFQSPKKKEKEKYQLDMDIISAPPMTKWVSPSELPLLPPPIQILRRRKPTASTVGQFLSQNKRRENHHLDHYVQVKEEQLQMENYLMAATGKDRTNLLLRRKQLLPKIPPSGLEQPLIRLERAESPIIDSAACLFNISDHMKMERKGICPRMKKEKQGYTLVEEYVGCPEVTDLILENLGLNQDDDLEEVEGFSLTKETKKKKFIPKIEKLGVLGNVKHHSHRSITSETKATMNVQFSGHVKSQDNWQGKRSGRHFSCATAVEKHSMFNFNITGSSASLWIGDMALSWSSEPESRARPWITEVGCTADLGQNEMCSIRLTNMGTTAINYKFVRKERDDAFDLNKYKLKRFIIDSDEKIILPGETFRVPILYKSIEPGYYSEDWHLLTRPVMENGAEIILRMWGITRSFDTFCHERQLLDSTINHRETLAIVKDRVHKLVYNLLLKEASAVDGRFKQELLGPDLFRYHNPNLNYHTAEVFRLGKLLEMLDDRKIKSTTPKKSANKLEYLEESPVNVDLSRTSLDNIEPIISTVLYKDSDPEDEEEGEEELIGIGLTEATLDHISEPSSSRVTPLPNKKATTETWQTHLIRKINTELRTKNLMSITGESEGLLPILNIANCDFAVDHLCLRILEEIDVLEEQEAYFRIVAQQLSKLFFRTEITAPNIGTTVALGLLAKTLDQFSDYAFDVKIQCCETWLKRKTISERTEKTEEAAAAEPLTEVVTENLVEEPQPVLLEIPVDDVTESNISIQEDYNVSRCEDFNPREDLDPSSYRSQYYDRIYTKMYLLLSEYFDSLDLLLSHVDVKKVASRQPEPILPGIQRTNTYKFSFFQCGNRAWNGLSEQARKANNLTSFRAQIKMQDKVKHLTTRTDQIETLLNAPLPPLWVRLAQRMDAAANIINAKHSKSSHEKSFSDT